MINLPRYSYWIFIRFQKKDQIIGNKNGNSGAGLYLSDSKPSP